MKERNSLIMAIVFFSMLITLIIYWSLVYFDDPIIYNCSKLERCISMECNSTSKFNVAMWKYNNFCGRTCKDSNQGSECEQACNGKENKVMNGAWETACIGGFCRCVIYEYNPYGTETMFTVT